MNTTPAPTASAITDEQIDAYLKAQRETVEEADRFGRPNVGGLHTNTVREACRNGLAAALALQPAMSGAVPAGWKLVPVEPSAEMKLASKRYKAKATIPTGPGVYRSMIEAAPAAPIEAAQPASSSAPAVGARPFVDRGDAVNLARNILTEPAWTGTTSKGVRVLAEAVMLMDAALAAPSTGQDAAQAVARDALEEIALSGTSGSGQESEDGMREWHARRAWEFIGIAARALDAMKVAAQGDGGTTA